MAIGTVLAVGSAISGASGARRGRKAGDEASDQAQKALDAQMGQLGKTTDMLDALRPTIDKFAQQGQDSFDRYQNMFGPLEESLNNYYTNLDPDQYAAQGNQTAQQTYQNSMNQVNEQLAAQGIQNSGVSSQMAYDQGNQMAQTKAQNIMNAPEQVAQQQQGWMNYGAGRQDNAFNQMQSGVNAQSGLTNQYNQAYTNMANAYGNQSAQANQAAQQNYNQGNQSLQQGMRGVGMGLYGGSQGWFDKKKKG